MLKITLIIVTLIVVIVCSLCVWIAFQPATKPSVSITLLGYTNDASGAPLAKFAVTNLDRSTIFAYNPHIEIPAPAKPSGVEPYPSGTRLIQRLTLDTGASGVFTCPIPTNQASWKLSFYVYPDAGVTRLVKHMTVDAMWMIGLKPRYQTMPFKIEGGWIESKK